MGAERLTKKDEAYLKKLGKSVENRILREMKYPSFRTGLTHCFKLSNSSEYGGQVSSERF